MRIISLIENTTKQDNIKTEHGLSLYIEWMDKKLLFDTGASDLFLTNAKEMKIDISDIDAVILSHGHYDHGGGIASFLEANDKAKVYVQQEAFMQYLSADKESIRDIGIDRKLEENPRIVKCQGKTQLYPGGMIFDGVTERRFFSPANKTMLVRTHEHGCNMEPDEFHHEQYLLLEEDGKRVLFGGCCHNGIINVMNKAVNMNCTPDVTISGFHFLHMDMEKFGPFVDLVAKELTRWNTTYYTCHCTGEEAYKRMKKILGDKILYFACGDEIEI